jgi:hypothetical protein
MLPFSAEFEKEVLALAGSPDKDIRDKAAADLGAPTMISKITQTGYHHL